MFEGTTLTNCNLQQFNAVRSKIIENIEQALMDMFSEFSSTTVVKATRIADIKTWPKEWDELKGLAPLCVLLY